MSLLIMHLSANPISLNNKFDIGHIILLDKIIFYLLYFNKINSFIIFIKQSLDELYNKLPEFKNNLYTYITNNSNKNNINEFQPLIDININEINLSNIIFNKCINFWNFITKNNSANNTKNERKIKIKKFVVISNLLISLIFSQNKKGMNEIIEKINSYFISHNKEENLMKFLMKINLLKILFLIFENINLENNDDLKDNILSCSLYYISVIKSTNAYDSEFFSIEKKFENYLKKNIKEFLDFFGDNKYQNIEYNDNYEKIKIKFIKTIVLITNLSILYPNLRNIIKDIFINYINDIQNIIGKKMKNKEYLGNKFANLINNNISILSRIIYIKN